MLTIPRSTASLAHRTQDAIFNRRLILENSLPGTCILMRSASPAIDFIPDFAMKRLQLNTPFTDRLHQKDRVGTHGCTLLAHVTP